MAFDLGTAVGYLDLDTSGFHKGFRSAGQDLHTFTTTAHGVEEKTAALGSAFTGIGRTLTKTVTVPLLGAGTAAVGIAAKFDSAMSEVQAISGATGEDLLSLRDKAKEMGATTKFSASEAAAAMKYMAMAGWKTEDMLSGIAGIMDLAAASGEDLATTSDIVTDALTAFGLTAQDSAMFSDVLAAASNNANTNVSMLGESFKFIAPVAGAMGYSVQDVTLALGLMANSGIKASTAGTVLRASLTNMVKPTKQMAGVMSKYGLSLTDSEGNMKSLKGVMDDLRDKFGGLSEAEQASAAATLFGKEAMSGMLAIINASEEDYDKLSRAIEGADGTSKDMANTMQNNLVGQLTILKSTLEGIAISFGEILMPVVKDITGYLQKLAEKVNNLTTEQKELIAKMLTFAAVLGPAFLVIGKFITGISHIVGALKVLKGGFAAVHAALAASSAPVLGIIAGIVAAVVALKFAWDNNFGGIRDKTVEIWNVIKEMFQDLVRKIIQFKATFLRLWEENWMGCKDILTRLWTAIETVFSLALDTLLETFKFWQAVFNGDWKSAWESVKSIFNNILDALIELLAACLTSLVDLIVNIGESLWSAAKTAFTRIKDGFSNAWDTVMEWFNRVKEDPVEAIKSIGRDLYDAGSSVIDSLLDGFRDAWGWLRDWVNDKVAWIKDRFNIHVNTPTIHDSGSSSGSFASGLSYVPRDMVVKVHEGESIRTKQQTKGDTNHSGGDTFNFYSPEPIDADVATRQIKQVKRDLAEGF